MRRLLYMVIFLGALGHAQTVVNYNRFLRSNFGSQTMWDGVTLNIYGIAPTLSASPEIPAPTIYCNEGDSVVINALSISQLHHHTIHLHGLDVDTRNDGDPATSFELQHMQDTTYSFKANNAGTYIYHCHVGDVVHVQMGMYGSIIVRAAAGANMAWTGGPAFNREYSFLTSEIDKFWHDSVPEHDTLTDYITLPSYLPDYFLVNGKSEWQLDADSNLRVEGAQGDFIYLRLTNIGFYDNLYVFPTFLQAQIIDSDGRPLPLAYSSDSLYIAPGERYGVMLNPNAQLIDSIYLGYASLNTGIIENVQYIDVGINGYTGISNHFDAGWKLYPNPTKDQVQIKMNFKSEGNFILSLSDAKGVVLVEKPLVGTVEMLDVSGYSGGSYFVSIRGLGLNTTKKLIIK